MGAKVVDNKKVFIFAQFLWASLKLKLLRYENL